MRNFTQPFIALAILLWLTCDLSAQAQAPANDDPCGAVVLMPSGQLCIAPTVGTLQAATSTTPNGYSNQNTCGNVYGQPFDVWYKFTTTSSGLGSTGATVSVTGNAAAQLRLFSAASCAGPFTQLGCEGATTPNTSSPSLAATGLFPNTTYYVRVATNTAGPFTICLTDGPGLVPCTPLAVSAPLYSNPDNSAATVTFVAASTHVPPFTVYIRQYVGTSVNLLRQYTTPTVAPVVLTGLVAGERYEVEVRAACSTGGLAGGRSTFTVSPPNDEPCGAVPLLVDPSTGCNALAGGVGGATPTVPTGYGPPSCAPSFSGTDEDVWYTFQTALSGPASTRAVITVGNTAADGVLRLFAAASCAGPFAEVRGTAVQAAQIGPAQLVADGLLPNTRYFVSVALEHRLYLRGDFTICASVQPPALACPTPVRAVVLPRNITNTTAVVGVLLPSSSRQPASYTLTYASLNGSPTTVTFVPVPDPNSPQSAYTSLTGLTPNTTYTATIVANCAGGNSSGAVSVTFTTLAGPVVVPGQPPANDNCTAAQVLAVGTTCVPTLGTTLDATASAAGVPVPECMSLSTLGADVWYQMVVPASGTATVRLDSVAGSSLRGGSLAFYTGSCTSLTPLQCALGNVGSEVVATGAPGSTLFVRVWAVPVAGAFYAANGAFTICALDAPLPCPLVTNVAVGSITTTSASVSFVPGTGNQYFEVIATPVGGGPSVSVVDSASPIVLTGLLPGTAYVVGVGSNCAGTALGPGVRTTFTTLTPPVTCPAPTAFYVGSVTGTSASVNFTPVAGTTYVLTYTRAGGTAQTQSVTTSPVALSSLLLNTTYTVTLQATCAVGPAPLATTSFTTTSGCAAPLFLTVTALSGTTATIGFAAPAGSGGYLATITPAGGTAQAIAPAPVASPFTITGLLPGTGYTVALQSACTGNTVSATETVRFVTLTPVATCATPTAVSVGALSASTATVSFSGPAGAVGYTATATPTTGGPAVAVSGPASPLLLTGLLAGTAYSVAVTTNCGTGVGSAATSGTAFTTVLASRSAALVATVGLFPNPAHHSATLTVPVALLRQAVDITVLNAVGQVVHRATLPAARADAQVVLDLTTLPAGLYLVQLATGQGTLVKRLIVE